MVKTLKLGNQCIVTLSNGSTITKEVNEELYQKIRKCKTDEEVLLLIDDKSKELASNKELINELKESSILTFEDDCAYWKEVSTLSVPKDLAKMIIKAENDNNEILLETLKNFWTLLCLNTDELCRNKLYTFLIKHDLKIERSGFFITYRNVDKKDKNSTITKDTIFTDAHSHKFSIKIGEMVTMPREKCDSNSNVTCSRGLHSAGCSWIKKDYFGSVGIVCLINPADVVAVPGEVSEFGNNNEYGKLRSCAYLPIDFAKYDNEGNCIPYDVKTGFQCEYVPKVIYEGLMGTEEDSPYKIKLPDSCVKEQITNKLLDMALKQIQNRVVK